MVCKYCYAENADVFIGITARSNAFLDYEKYIQRTFYPYIIHPRSRFRVYWEGYFVVHIILRLTVICFFWAVLYHRNLIYQIIVLTFQVINLVDVCLMFFTGYVESSTDTVVLEPKKIALRYLTRFFVLDLIAFFPVDFLFFTFEESENQNQFSTINSTLTYSFFTIACSLTRFPIFILYLINLSRILLWDHLMVGMVLIWVVMYVVVLFASDFYLSQVEHEYRSTSSSSGFFISQLLEKSETERLNTYFDTLLLIILDCIFFNVQSPIESEYIKAVVLNLTFLASALFTAYFINYIIMRMKNHENFLDVEAQVRTFVTMRHFSSSLRNKTFLYFHILLENKYTKDEEVFNYIPDTFKGDIFYHLCLPLLKNFFCFEELPTFALRRLAESMNYQLYLPNEIVMSAEEPVLRMYFVQRGTVALYSSKGFELYHFEAGSNFNGRNFVLGELANTNYAISTEVTEVYRLNHTEFLDIMADFPHLFEKINEKIMGSRKDSSYLIE